VRITGATSPAAIRRIVDLARRLLGGKPRREVLQFVARVSDDLQLLADRIGRFGLDGTPQLDLVSVAVYGRTAALEPDVLFDHLSWWADLLIARTQRLSRRAWRRSARFGDDRHVMLADLVDGSLHRAVHGLVALLDDNAAPTSKLTTSGAALPQEAGLQGGDQGDRRRS
jgi:hypothetical protein